MKITTRSVSRRPFPSRPFRARPSAGRQVMRAIYYIVLYYIVLLYIISSFFLNIVLNNLVSYYIMLYLVSSHIISCGSIEPAGRQGDPRSASGRSRQAPTAAPVARFEPLTFELLSAPPKRVLPPPVSSFRMCLNCEVLKGMFPWRTRYPLS